MGAYGLGYYLGSAARFTGGVAAPAEVGGVAIGTAGGAGTLYEGYSLAMGDDFNTLSVIGPATPSAKYATTRLYAGSGPRGLDAVLQKQYNTDPLHTGHNDSNRGVAVGYDNMRISGSDIVLQARAATAPEQVHFQGTGRTRVAAVIDSIPAQQFHPGIAGTEDIIVEARIKWTNKTANPSGWHPTFWLLASDPATYNNGQTGVEIDVLEGNSQNAYFGSIDWTAGSANALGATVAHNYFDGQYHTVLIRVNKTNQTLYVDGVQVEVIARDGNFTNEPLHWIFSSHVYDASFHGESYIDAEWDSTGAAMNVDWVRVWKRIAQPHYKPLVTIPPANIAFGGSTTITLPSALSLWGDAGVTEYLSAVGLEENEPGMSHSAKYTRFPPGVSYNSGTRVLTVAPSSAQSGRILFNLMALKSGATCEPLNFWVNIGPRLITSVVFVTVNEPASIDFYALFDCGVLTSNIAGQKAKTLVVTGLPTGLSYSDATGLVTGTPTVIATTAVDVTVTNSVGQSLTTTVNVGVQAVTSLLFEDTFTASAGSLSGRVSETGGVWSLHPLAATPHSLSGTGSIYHPGADIGYMTNNQALSDPDYAVEADLRVKTQIAGGPSISINGRMSSSVLTYYGIRYSGTGSGSFILFKSVAGTLTTLATYAVGVADGALTTVTLEMLGDQIAGYVNGVLRMGPVTDATITAAGRVGTRIYSNNAIATTGQHFEAIRVLAL